MIFDPYSYRDKLGTAVTTHDLPPGWKAEVDASMDQEKPGVVSYRLRVYRPAEFSFDIDAKLTDDVQTEMLKKLKRGAKKLVKELQEPVK